MLTRFVCLANSLKEGGRCIAGIELDEQHQPVFFQERPKWIRPVWTTEHGEIPLHMAIAFDTLDILEMNVTGSKAEDISPKTCRLNHRFERLAHLMSKDWRCFVMAELIYSAITERRSLPTR